MRTQRRHQDQRTLIIHPGQNRQDVANDVGLVRLAGIELNGHGASPVDFPARLPCLLRTLPYSSHVKNPDLDAKYAAIVMQPNREKP